MAAPVLKTVKFRSTTAPIFYTVPAAGSIKTKPHTTIT